MKMSSTGEDTKTKKLVPLLCLLGAGILCTAAINKWKSVQKSEERHQRLMPWGLVLSEANIRDRITGSGMEGPLVPAHDPSLANNPSTLLGIDFFKVLVG
ncbi:hypothetical protein Tco_0373558 [Tanacetum coccineum]